MVCKLCDTAFTGTECPRCGLKPRENPVIWPLRSGEYEGWDIERVFKANPDYLKSMLQQRIGTGAQRALIRLLMEEPETTLTQPRTPTRAQDTAFRVWVIMAAI